jgi:hypothetical protein
MTLHHSPETHQSLCQRIPQATGREMSEWLRRLDDGPSLIRPDERINWLVGEHGVPRAYATAIVHEHERRRAAARR